MVHRLLLPLLALFLAVTKLSADDRPNIILIIADDLAWDDIGVYGHPTIRTPNLDRLAGEGMRFDQAFVTASSCSPSRASIITGRYPHNTDAEQLHWPVPAAQITFVEKLRTAGYWTGAAGKWHLGNEIKNRFDEIRESDPAGYQLAANARGADAKIKILGGADHEVQSGCTQWLPLLRARPQNQPFFLWLASLDPHRDYEEGISDRPYRPAELVLPAHLPDTPEVRRELALYYEEITRFDRYVGYIMDELDKAKLAKNTLIVLLSDNGRPFPRDKTSILDGGIKTPLIVRWPARLQPGTTCSQLISTVDLAPGLLAAAGLPALATGQGVNFLPLLTNPGKPIREEIFAEQNWHDYENRSRAIRTPHHALIVHDYPDLPLTPPSDVVRSVSYRSMQALRAQQALAPEFAQCFTAPRAPVEFYDLRSDPNQFNNLVNVPAYAPVIKQLQDKLSHWRSATADVAPAWRTPDEFDRETGAPLPARIRPRPSKADMKRAHEAASP